MSRTILQQHLRNKTIPLHVIRDMLKLDKSTVDKWASGKLYPQRQNAVGLIQVFGNHGVSIDFNDIYQIRNVL